MADSAFKSRPTFAAFQARLAQATRGVPIPDGTATVTAKELYCAANPPAPAPKTAGEAISAAVEALLVANMAADGRVNAHAFHRAVLPYLGDCQPAAYLDDYVALINCGGHGRRFARDAVLCGLVARGELDTTAELQCTWSDPHVRWLAAAFEGSEGRAPSAVYAVHPSYTVVDGPEEAGEAPSQLHVPVNLAVEVRVPRHLAVEHLLAAPQHLAAVLYMARVELCQLIRDLGEPETAATSLRLEEAVEQTSLVDFPGVRKALRTAAAFRVHYREAEVLPNRE